jgi:hypothetical protein
MANEKPAKKADERMFPIMDGTAIPWWVLEPCEEQAVHNHSQTLQRLAERGGLCASEALDVLHGDGWSTWTESHLRRTLRRPEEAERDYSRRIQEPANEALQREVARYVAARDRGREDVCADPDEHHGHRVMWEALERLGAKFGMDPGQHGTSMVDRALDALGAGDPPPAFPPIAPTRPVDGCSHAGQRVAAAVHRFIDRPEWMAEITIVCTDCGTPFKFLGLPSGVSFRQPRVSIDSRELVAPIAPDTGPVELHASATFDLGRRDS